MAHALPHFDYVTLADYLKAERETEAKNEYVDGHVYAMGGVSETHNTIAHTFGAAIDNALSDDCRAWQSDMKVIGHNRGKDFAYYPDIMVACGENTGDQYVRTNPLLIVEVLSPSTKRTDLTEKLDNYTNIASLLEYVVVSQETPHIIVYRRRASWQPTAYSAHDELTLESIELSIPVARIYRRVRREVGLD